MTIYKKGILYAFDKVDPRKIMVLRRDNV